MKSWERWLIPGGLALAGLLFLFAAFKPSFNGLPMNTTFFVLGVVFLILGFALSRKIARANGGPKV